MTHDYIIKKLDAIIFAEKQIMERNCQILKDINEAEKQIKEVTNDKKTTV